MLRDLRLAIRSLRSWRLGAVGAVLTLAVGIGTTTAFYAVLRALLAQTAVSIQEAERVARIYGANPTLGIQRSSVALGDFEFTLARARSFESIAAYQSTQMAAGTDAASETLTVTSVSWAFFDLLRAHAADGRLLTRADYADSVPRAVVSELTWRRHFAGRSLHDNATIRLDGHDYAVVGVTPISFSFPFIGITSDVWIPLSPGHVDRGTHVSVIARLAPGTSWASASTEIASLPPPRQAEGTWRWRTIPIEQDTRTRTTGAMVWVLLPPLVVLIAGCVNVACMLLARGLRRDTELSVRVALGATRGTLFRQLLIENALIASASGIAGAALAIVALDVVGRVLMGAKPLLAANLPGDAGLLPIALVVSAAACLLFGAVPALRLSRRDVAATLKGAVPPPRVNFAGYNVRDLVVFVELGLAVVLVVFTAMSFTVLSVLQDTQIGFAIDELVAVRVPARHVTAAVERVRAVGGVTGVAVASALPGSRRGGVVARAPGGRSTPVSIIEVGNGFFETVALEIVRGRSFHPDETADTQTAVIGESGASALWPNEDPIGKLVDLVLGARSTRLVVIGVARDAVRMAIPGPHAADVYRPLATAAGSPVVLLARSPRAKSIAREIAATARAADATAASDGRTLGDTFSSVPAESVAMMRLFGAFALVALLLSASGIFAVVSQSVTQRTSEFGVRLALGATRWRVLRMVLTRELRLIAAALATGAAGTVALVRSSGFDDAAFIVAVSASRPESLIGLVGLCGAVAVAACGMATYGIVKLDPWEVLRKS